MRKNTGSNSGNMIIFDHVSEIYGGKDVALEDVSFSVPAGSFTCIVGPSGGGKSTIVKLIAGLIEPASGTLVKPDRVSMVFQSGALLPWLSALDNVALPLEARGMERDKAVSVARKCVRTLGLRGLEAKLPRELSGGERQRVGIARALAVRPAVLLLDEPFAALDPKTADELHADIGGIWRETGMTVVMVSHSIEEAVALATQVIVVKDHRVARIFPVDLPYPRRNHALGFSREAAQIRRALFK